MFCPDCGKEVPEGARFCASCGSDLAEEEEVSGAAATPPAAPPAGTMPAPPTGAALQPAAGKSNLAIWLSILAVVVVGGVAVLLIFLLTGDGGTSVADYRSQVSTILDESNAALDQLSWQDLGSSGFDDESADQLEQLAGEIESALPAFEDALSELEGIEPPEEAAGLHQDIVKYYRDSIKALKDLEAMSAYMVGIAEASLRMEDDMESLNSSFSNAASEQEFMAALDQILAVMDAFIAEASALKPPSFMDEFHAALVSSIKEMRGIFVELKGALASGDTAALDALEGRLETVEDKFESRIDASLEEMDRFIDELDALDRELQELTDRLQAL